MNTREWVGDPVEFRSETLKWPNHKKLVPLMRRGVVFETAEGFMAVAFDAEERLIEASLPEECAEAAAEVLGLVSLRPADSDDPARVLIGQIRRYFEGERVQFEGAMNLSALTPFQRDALECCASIPYGELRSYRWIAERIGRFKSARPVGQAMRINPIPVVIPCHRVIGSNGEIIGYGGGAGWKERLLRLEGVTF